MNDNYNTMNFDAHEILEDTHNDVNLVKMTEGKYKDLIFSLGKVSVDEEEGEELKLTFEYDVHSEGVEFVKEELEQYLGEFVKELLIFNLSRHEVVFTGGVDEPN